MNAIYTLLILLIPFIVSGQCNRLETVNNFNSIYLNTGVSTDELSWTGNIETCQSGSVSLISLKKEVRASFSFVAVRYGSFGSIPVISSAACSIFAPWKGIIE